MQCIRKGTSVSMVPWSHSLPIRELVVAHLGVHTFCVELTWVSSHLFWHVHLSGNEFTPYMRSGSYQLVLYLALRTGNLCVYNYLSILKAYISLLFSKLRQTQISIFFLSICFYSIYQINIFRVLYLIYV